MHSRGVSFREQTHSLTDGPVRLTHIKLAGFKSFADPTVIPTPSQLVGVVGPNGCGKSNIIDATRWVLGETRAAELRGESMQDVIFSGSGDRKPAGRASVELVFDNSDGRAVGQWSTYSEISVRRVLTRDGTSSYFINNQQVRRRDVHDIFLGTGLGTRGYAIIGQGMINRLLEARPEELRVYLEEAAGVSRYKERRRETENRLQDTRESLTRVDDILRELTAQQSRLEVQAEVAARFRALQRDVQTKQHALWYLREQVAKQDQQRLTVRIEQAQIALEESTAALRSAQADLERRRQAHYDASDAVHKAQASLYEVNAQVSSLEAQIRHVADTRARLQARQQQLRVQIEQWHAQISHCTEQIDQEQQVLEQREMAMEQAQALAQEAADQLPEIESRVLEAGARRDAMRATLATVEQKLALTAQRRGDVQRQLDSLEQRRQRLSLERGSIQVPDAQEAERLAGDAQAAQAQLEQAQAILIELEERVPQAEATRAQAQQEAQQQAGILAKLEARLAALVRLQEDVQSSGTLDPWIRSHELANLPRLLEKLKVNPGWESAIESALQERLNGLQVSSLDRVRGLDRNAPPGRLAFYQMPQVSPITQSPAGLTSLANHVQTGDPSLKLLISDWLGSFYVAQSLTQALDSLEQLPPGAIWIVQAGHLIDRHSVRFYAPESEQAGMLARQQEIENLRREVKAQQLIAEQTRAAAAQAQAQWQQASQAVGPARQRLTEMTQRLHGLQLAYNRVQQELSQSQARAGRLDQDLEELMSQVQVLTEEFDQIESTFESLDEELAKHQDVFSDLEMACESLAGQARTMRDKVRETERRQQEALFAQRTTRARIEELERNLSLASEQHEKAQVEAEALLAETEELDAEVAREGLQHALEIRSEREAVLGRLRIEMETLASQMREADEQRVRLERSMQPQRDSIMELQLQEQAARLAVEQYAQQLQENEVDRAALIAHLETQTEDWKKLTWLQSEVQRGNREMDSLGPVNLAALEELTAAKERATFLQSQYTDLQSAIETLEDAIRKIDRETRELLQTTFDEVNRHFGELFPKLFGGGEAKLVMTGDQILDSGVQVMAQPPGKRNTTIHLLSGGEKALTATALVFALFKLNPAPFCLLDEVDAPLDDANTERYANLVSGMSDQTQFLFISHNKIAMQMARHLIGVTMQEQGVSRIVAVDIDSALQLAAEAA
ncbi:chromosome segregation protein SMC [Orrella marina]|uniref:Chromosome partition protein Smc n=1 Tax=Orrella marina TaxID=2163011 RepID=A0A2R4XJR9_9BURK|nr:chromosome segregation protein SMC [Orrella marina]